VKVFNTLSGKKEEFLPQGSEIKIYVCGVTPYDECHIGHAMSYIIFDVIRRYLKFQGYQVKYVQNVTDIDDKIIDRANQRGVKASELAQQYTDNFFKDMDALNILRAHVYPKASEEIPKIIEIVEDLITRRARIKEILHEKKDPMMEARSESLKLLANSFYGYLGFYAARWYCLECARSVTAYGRYYINKVIKQAQEKGFNVLF